ncbi:MAG: tyrosine-type recombinase/integrase [Methanosarcina sp.]
MISLTVSTGLRREDLENVRRNDYNAEKRTLTYFEHKKKRTRTVFISSRETIKLLNMHLPSCRKSEWLFPSSKQTGKFKTAFLMPLKNRNISLTGCICSSLFQHIHIFEPFHENKIRHLLNGL